MPSPQDIINAPKIQNTGTEDAAIAGQTINYDIRFSAVTPKSDRTESIERLMDDMCNLSDGVEAIGYERGLVQDIITTCKDLGISFIDTVERIAIKLNITKIQSENIGKLLTNRSIPIN